MKTLQEFIKESLIQHIALELKDEDIIYERYGLYDGCNELIDFIINKIDEDNKLVINYDEVKHLKNIVFEVFWHGILFHIIFLEKLLTFNS